jgi:hypothetical protein
MQDGDRQRNEEIWNRVKTAKLLMNLKANLNCLANDTTNEVDKL